MACLRLPAHCRRIGLTSGTGDGSLSRTRARNDWLRGWRRWGLLRIFKPGVLLSKMIEGGTALRAGSTLAVRREALEKAAG
jgi:hypothetical protein